MNPTLVVLVLYLVFQSVISDSSAPNSGLQNVTPSLQNEKTNLDVVTSKTSKIITETTKVTINNKSRNNNKNINLIETISSEKGRPKKLVTVNNKSGNNNKNINLIEATNSEKVRPKNVLANTNSKNSVKNAVTRRNQAKILPMRRSDSRSDFKTIIEYINEIENKLAAAKQTVGKNPETKTILNNVFNEEMRNEKGKDEDNDYNIFGDMTFPPTSKLPDGLNTNTATTNTEVLWSYVFPEDDSSKIFPTFSTTTGHNDLLLDPKDFGYTTTRRPIPTYGDTGRPSIPSEYLTVRPAQSAFVTAFKNDMARFGNGVFTTAIIKMFHWVIFKKPDDVRRLVWGFGRLVDRDTSARKFDDFGQPTKHAFAYTTQRAADMPADERRTQAILLHNMLKNRMNVLSDEVNFLLDYIDSLYLKEESENLIRAMEPLDKNVNINGVPYTLIGNFLWSALAPWQRLKNTFRGETLKEKLNRAIKTRFYGDGDNYSGAGSQDRHDQRTKNINIDIAKNTVNKNINATSVKKEKAERRHEDNLKIIHWTPEVTYRGHNRYNTDKGVKEESKDKFDYDSEEINDIMSELTPRSITTRAGRNKRKKKKIDGKAERLGEKNEEDQDSGMNKETSRPSTKKHKKKKDVEHDDDDDASEFELMIQNTRPTTKKYNTKRLVLEDADDSESEVKVTTSVSNDKRPRKRHRYKHKRKHRSTLEKILKIIKYLRSYHKREKHRHHHKYSKFWSKFRATDIDEKPTQKLPEKLSHDRIEAESNGKDSDEYVKFDDKNRFRFEMGKTTAYEIPTKQFYNFEEQLYDKRDLAFRRSFNVDDMLKDKVDKIKFSKLREDNSGSDEEIILKMNLLKAMGGLKELDAIHARRSNNRGPLESSCSVDEEAFLKSKLYKYLQTN